MFYCANACIFNVNVVYYVQINKFMLTSYNGVIMTNPELQITRVEEEQYQGAEFAEAEVHQGRIAQLGARVVEFTENFNERLDDLASKMPKFQIPTRTLAVLGAGALGAGLVGNALASDENVAHTNVTPRANVGKTYSKMTHKSIMNKIVHIGPYPGRVSIHPRKVSVTDNVLDLNGKCSSNVNNPIFKKYLQTPTSIATVGCDGRRMASHDSYSGNPFSYDVDRTGQKIANGTRMNPELFGSAISEKANSKQATVVFSRPEDTSVVQPVKKMIVKGHQARVYRYE